MTKQEKEQYQAGFKNSLREYLPNVKDSTINMHYSDAFYIYNNKDVGLDLQEIIINNKIPDDYIEKIEKHIIKKNKEKEKISGQAKRSDPLGRAKGYKRSLSFLLDHLKGKPNNVSVSNPITKSKSILLKKPKEVINEADDLISTESYIIAGKSEKEFDLINKAYQFNSKDKKTLFEEVPETRELWRNIRTPCRSDGDFCKFINSLYMLFFETTKDKEPYGIVDKNGYPVHIKRLPENFIKQGSFTYHFMDIIGILRHVKGFAHIPSKLKLPPWKTAYEDAIQELLGYEPTVDEDFNKLQIELLKKLEKVMIYLHKIIKNSV